MVDRPVVRPFNFFSVQVKSYCLLKVAGGNHFCIELGRWQGGSLGAKASRVYGIACGTVIILGLGNDCSNETVLREYPQYIPHFRAIADLGVVPSLVAGGHIFHILSGHNPPGWLDGQGYRDLG